jgi:hypothetical protein
MMVEVLREVAAALRAESGSCIAPVQAAFNGLAARLEGVADGYVVVAGDVQIVNDEPITVTDVQIVVDDEPIEDVE